MFRAFLIAIGISMCLVGGECLVVDQAVVAYPAKSKGTATKSPNAANFPFGQQSYATPATDSGIVRREISPPEWAPWSLLAGGVVIALYAITVQRD
ncbi:MAG: hypothetical protein QGG09_03135 [Pirellulaceae bacterium]|jgi:hypothetical protein|nr:hypothetical protein [Pirellulaceae bacterium]HJN12785.1 hypothetical protein [Pirellulaceae bacterium]